jgi:toluene monooxygenase electron transfer component
VKRANATPPQIVPAEGEGRVVEARILARDILAFSIELDRPIEFHAGQFVGLRFPEVPGFRSYSMVNHDRNATRLDFVVKRKAEGGLTPWLFDRALEGPEVQWFGPLGRAIFEPGGGEDILCIAGGTGIAGMLSILRCAARTGHFARSRGRVFFGVRAMHDAFYLAELSELAAASRGALEVTVALSEEDPAPEATRSYPHLAFRAGLVHEVAKGAVGARYGGIAYLAGPPPAVDAAMRVLLAARVPARNIRFDKFT